MQLLTPGSYQGLLVAVIFTGAVAWAVGETVGELVQVCMQGHKFSLLGAILEHVDNRLIQMDLFISLRSPFV